MLPRTARDQKRGALPRMAESESARERRHDWAPKAKDLRPPDFMRPLFELQQTA
jgi:hypothetical protein